MIEVQSSDLAWVEYNWSGTLTIGFHSGGVYDYYGVPPSKYASLMNANSHGKYFHANIKRRYSYRKVSG
jgi:hypothetical protein